MVIFERKFAKSGVAFGSPLPDSTQSLLASVSAVRRLTAAVAGATELFLHSLRLAQTGRPVGACPPWRENVSLAGYIINLLFSINMDKEVSCLTIFFFNFPTLGPRLSWWPVFSLHLNISDGIC